MAERSQGLGTLSGRQGPVPVDTLPSFKWTRRGFRSGFIKGIPLALSIASYGFLFGIIAKEKQVGFGATLQMSLIVFAGTAQFGALDIWHATPPVLALFFQTLVINSRHLLMGLSLRNWYRGASRPVRYISAFFMIDESWALTLNELDSATTDAGFMIGSGSVMYLAWALSTVVGYSVDFIADRRFTPEKLGLDVALPCVLVILVIPRWEGRGSLLPWICAALVSVLCDRWLPPGWNVLLGGISGVLADSFFGRLEKNDD